MLKLYYNYLITLQILAVDFRPKTFQIDMKRKIITITKKI